MKTLFMIALAAVASAATVATDKAETKVLEEASRWAQYGQYCGWQGQDFYTCTQGLYCNERQRPSVCDWANGGGNPGGGHGGGNKGHHGDSCNPRWDSCEWGLECKFEARRRGYYCDRRDDGGHGGGGGGGGRPGDRGSPCNNEGDCQRGLRCEFGRGGGRVGQCV